MIGKLSPYLSNVLQLSANRPIKWDRACSNPSVTVVEFSPGNFSISITLHCKDLYSQTSSSRPSSKVCHSQLSSPRASSHISLIRNTKSTSSGTPSSSSDLSAYSFIILVRFSFASKLNCAVNRLIPISRIISTNLREELLSSSFQLKFQLRWPTERSMTRVPTEPWLFSYPLGASSLKHSKSSISMSSGPLERFPKVMISPVSFSRKPSTKPSSLLPFKFPTILRTQPDFIATRTGLKLESGRLTSLRWLRQLSPT